MVVLDFYLLNYFSIYCIILHDLPYTLTTKLFIVAGGGVEWPTSIGRTVIGRYYSLILPRHIGDCAVEQLTPQRPILNFIAPYIT